MKKIEPEIVLAKLDFMTDYLDSLSAFESITLEDYLSDRYYITELPNLSAPGC
jgi:hypothetical protein